MIRSFWLRLSFLAIAAVGFGSKQAGAVDPVENAKAVVPTKTIALVSGDDLKQHWYTWLTDDRHEDPRGVFKMQPDGTLRISGDGFGGMITHKEYADYYLYMEYRWGTATFRNRVKAARDGGILLHCQGPDGNFGGTKEA